MCYNLGPDLLKNSEFEVLGVKAVLSRCVVLAYRVHLRAHVHVFVASAEFVIACYLFQIHT